MVTAWGDGRAGLRERNGSKSIGQKTDGNESVTGRFAHTCSLDPKVQAAAPRPGVLGRGQEAGRRRRRRRRRRRSVDTAGSVHKKMTSRSLARGMPGKGGGRPEWKIFS